MQRDRKLPVMALRILLSSVTIGCIAMACFDLWSLKTSGQLGQHGRHLLTTECVSRPWERKGGFLLYASAVLYFVIGLSVVCEFYFIPAVEVMVEKLQLSEDVAGATLLAAGSSMPEVFFAFFTLAPPGADSSIGLGTIVGSAVFNILVVIGGAAIAAGRPLALHWQPLVRDAFFYALAVGSLIVVFEDGKITWWECLLGLDFYMVYILVMHYNTEIWKMFVWLTTRKPKVPASTGAAVQPQHTTTPDSKDAKGAKLDLEAARATEQPIKAVVAVRVDPAQSGSSHPPQQAEQPAAATLYNAGFDPFMRPREWYKWPFWALAYPWHVVMSSTIPDCSKPHLRKWYIVASVISVVWLGVMAWLTLGWAERFGCVIGLPDSVMAVTILAVGSSVPDLLVSIPVARRGQGDMAVANGVGSNIFNIWGALAFPYMCVLLWKNEVAVVDSEGMLTNAVVLLAILVFYMALILANGCRLTPRVGWLMIVVYVFYLVWNVTHVWYRHFLVL